MEYKSPVFTIQTEQTEMGWKYIYLTTTIDVIRWLRWLLQSFYILQTIQLSDINTNSDCININWEFYHRNHPRYDGRTKKVGVATNPSKANESSFENDELVILLIKSQWSAMWYLMIKTCLNRRSLY